MVTWRDSNETSGGLVKRMVKPARDVWICRRSSWI